MTELPLLAPFLPNIRMRLHLERLRPDQAHTTTVTINDRAQLGAMLSCYRRTTSRVETSLENPLSRPMTVKDVALELDNFSPSNRAAFLAYVDELAAAPQIPRWRLPVYDLGGGRMFLMDGNHRAVATYIAGKPFEHELVVLHAPVDRRILVSLKYWDGGLSRFGRRLGLVRPASAHGAPVSGQQKSQATSRLPGSKGSIGR